MRTRLFNALEMPNVVKVQAGYRMQPLSAFLKQPAPPAIPAIDFVPVIWQYRGQRLVYEMHVAIAPALLGAGERLFNGIDLPALGYACTQHVASPNATHLALSRQ